LAALLKPFGAVALLDEADSRSLWNSIRHVKPFAGASSHARPLWRISTAPAQAHRLVDLITPAAQMFYDWGGGLAWIAVPANGDAGASVVRAAVAEARGHATLVRAPAEVRAVVDVFEPLSQPLMRLSRGVKEAFDPAGIFEPGRMYAGI
jgi:glycolate oxidase FAD binding subunit